MPTNNNRDGSATEETRRVVFESVQSRLLSRIFSCLLFSSLSYPLKEAAFQNPCAADSPNEMIGLSSATKIRESPSADPLIFIVGPV